MLKHLLPAGLLITILWLSWGYRSISPVAAYPEKLSEYHFFKGTISDLHPGEDVIPYDLNTPLFTDYAYKARFIRLPKGESATYDAYEVLDFPVGTQIIKTFYYPHDFRKPQKGRTLLETRVLIKENTGWKALPYIWNEDQSEAYLDVAGGRKDISWKDENGKKHQLNYTIPNMNQCKGCHIKGDQLTPIGPSARQLNGDYAYDSDTINQLVYWQELGILDNLPELESIPKLAQWDDPQSGTLADRARAYLDINCGHCHNPAGPANTSGLYLDIHTEDPTALGIKKAPVAAGRGSGGHQFDIFPGDANASILVYRLDSDDPGVMMPELGRKSIHTEGVELIRSWIDSLDPKTF